MAPRKQKPKPKSLIPKRSILQTKDTGVKKTGDAPKTPVKRHRNGLLNLTKTPRHLVERAQRNANESPLLRLPPELRNKVWAMAVKVGRVDILPQSLGCHRKVDPTLVRGGAVFLDEDGGIVKKHYNGNCYYSCCPVREPSAFHLPEVCRQIYAETATLACSVNTFLISSRKRENMLWVKHLSVAQRDAIHAVELNESYFQFKYMDTKTMPFRKRGLRNLTHVYISPALQRDAKKYFEDDWATLLKANVKAREGEDLVVEFPGGNNCRGRD